MLLLIERQVTHCDLPLGNTYLYNHVQLRLHGFYWKNIPEKLLLVSSTEFNVCTIVTFFGVVKQNESMSW